MDLLLLQSPPGPGQPAKLPVATSTWWVKFGGQAAGNGGSPSGRYDVQTLPQGSHFSIFEKEQCTSGS